MERYEEEGGRYVLYVGGCRAGTSDAVALLVDVGRSRMITHGDPTTVRRELDELRALCTPEQCEGWLLLEGRPGVAALNRALGKRLDLQELHLAFARSTAEETTRRLLARLQVRMTAK